MKVDPKKEQVFYEIFERNLWGDNDSRSGPGSNIHQTRTLRRLLPDLLLRYEVKSLLDIPCGDFHWMSLIKKELDGVLDRYTGGDIVDKIVQSDNLSYGDAKFKFHLLDLTQFDLPYADLVFCRDCLVHFSYNDILHALRSIKKSGAKYLLTTSFTNDNRTNADIPTGGWRPLNFAKMPFMFPKPLDVIVEECSENDGVYHDKSMVLWKVSDINVYRIYSSIMLLRAKRLIKLGWIKLFS